MIQTTKRAVVLALAMTALCPALARANQIEIYARTTVIDISPTGDQTLPASSLAGSGTMDASAGPQDVSLTLKTAGATDGSGNMVISPFTTGQVTTRNDYANGPANGYIYAATVSTGIQGGTFGFSQLLSPGSLGGNTNSSYASLSNGNQSLTVLGGGSGVVMTGGSYTTIFNIEGNYSGAAAPAITYVTPGPGFTVSEDFVYDATTNITTLELVNNNYQGGGPRAEFTLTGTDFTNANLLVTSTFDVADVPEPMSASLLMGGLAGIGLIRHKRRSGTST